MSERASRKRSPTNHFQLEPSCKGSKEKCHLMQESIETEIFRQLKSQNESLLQQMAVVKNQLAHKEAEVRRLNTQLERIDLRKLPASEQENEYEKKSAGWKVKIKKLGEIKDQDSQKIQELTTELDSLRKFWNGMRERVRKAELNLRSSEDKLKASEEKWKNCEKKLESVREELTNDLDQERVLLETLNCELEQKKREFDQLVSNNRYLGRMMEEAEEEKRQAVEENQQMKEEVEGYKGECARLTQICKLNEERINWYAGRLIRAEAVAGRANEQGPTCVKPICVICRFRFGTEGERTPRVLPCGHSLCEECAGRIIEMAIQQSEEDAARGAEIAEAEGRPTPDPYVPPAVLQIACPSCRRRIQVDPNADNIPKNFTVIDSIIGSF